jgi:hypothetical protein
MELHGAASSVDVKKGVTEPILMRSAIKIHAAAVLGDEQTKTL